MAVLAMPTNTTTNATPGSPPASAAANNAANDNDNNDNDDDNGIDLDALCRHVCNLRCMLDTSADCLADAKANAAIACIECVRTSELTQRRVGEWIRQVEEELRRTRIKAWRFRAGWTRLCPAVGGRGRKRRAEGALASALLLAAAAAKANPPSPYCVLGGGSGVCFSPSRPPPMLPLIVILAEDPWQDRGWGGR